MEIELSIEIITLLLFGSMFLLIMLGLPIAFVIGGVAVFFTFFLWGPNGLTLVATKASSTMKNFNLMAIPLFIYMASVLERSGIAGAMYDMMYKWMGRLRGGLAAGTVLICTVIAAMSGVCATGTITMTMIGLPSMLKRGYDKRMAMGCIMAGGALGPLIPPSVTMIVYGSITAEVSVGQLFMGGVFPGLLLSSLFISYILILCWRDPNRGPSLVPEDRANWKEKIYSLRSVILPVSLVIAVLGSIFAGLATPSEAAAVGAFGSLICVAINRKVNWTFLKETAFPTMKVTAMIVWIIFAAGLFSSVYEGLGASELIKGLLDRFHLGYWAVLIFIQLIFFLLGFVMETIAILLITYPVFLPLVTIFGYDPLWFAILFILNTQMGYLTPPFGTNLFYMKACAPAGTDIKDIYLSVIPFVLLQATGLVIVVLVPEIATWLPDKIF